MKKTHFVKNTALAFALVGTVVGGLAIAQTTTDNTSAQPAASANPPKAVAEKVATAVETGAPERLDAAEKARFFDELSVFLAESGLQIDFGKNLPDIFIVEPDEEDRLIEQARYEDFFDDVFDDTLFGDVDITVNFNMAPSAEQQSHEALIEAMLDEEAAVLDALLECASKERAAERFDSFRRD